MNIVIQRVTCAHVKTGTKEVAQIGRGLVLLVGFEIGDDMNLAVAPVKKILNFRIFDDAQEKMNLSVTDIRGDILVVPNFTLVADIRKGNRPSFDTSLPPHDAQHLFGHFVENLKLSGLNVQSGMFGEYMKIALTNDGPVTFSMKT